jgi:replication-associated recombination protein RarA
MKPDPEIGLAASALQKSIRAGNEELAVGWGLWLWKKAPYYVWKRLLVCACEDIGMANPDAVAQVAALAWAYRAARSRAHWVSPHPVTMAILILARSKKSTEVEDVQSLWLERFKAGLKPETKPEFLDMHTAEGRASGRGAKDWYRDRLAMGMPVNPWLEALWRLRPAWDPRPSRDNPSPSGPGESAP